MVHYVGLDVSLKQTSICVVNHLGSIVREGVVDSEPEAIAAFVRLNAPGAVRIGLETGPTATWLWTELKQLGRAGRGTDRGSSRVDCCGSATAQGT